MRAGNFFFHLVPVVWLFSIARLSAANSWLGVLDDANQKAMREHKLVLQVYKRSNVVDQWSDLIATDSYAKLEREVFLRPEFQKFAQKYLILQLFDFSNGIPRDDKTQQALHQSLQFWEPQIKVYPTLLLHDTKWTSLGRREGYKTGEAGAVMAWLRQAVVPATAPKN